MYLTKEQMIMLKEIWSVLKGRSVDFISKTRHKNVDVAYTLNNIKVDTLKLFNSLTEEEATIAKDFVDFVINTLISTKSLAKTIDKVYRIYPFLVAV